MKLEKDLNKSIREVLSLYMFTKTIIWWTRLNTGKIKTEYGKYIQLCDKGTPDFIVLTKNKNNNISVLFIEAKSDTGELRAEQEAFFNKYKETEGIYPVVIRDINELKAVINRVSYDRLQELTDLL